MPTGPAVPGGLEVFNYYLAKTLEQKLDNFELLATGDSEKLNSLIPIVEKSLGYSKRADFFNTGWNYRTTAFEEFAVYAKAIDRVMCEDRMTHFSMVNFLPVYLAAKNGKKSILTMHMGIENFSYKILFDLLTPEQINLITFVGVSGFQMKDFSRQHEIIPNGVYLGDFPFSESAKDNFVWIGRMIEPKGATHAIKVASKLHYKLEIGGKPIGENEKYFRSDILPSLNDEITAVGFVDKEKRPGFYSAKALLFPSSNETFGLTVIEAMACGTPVIAYKTGAVDEIIENGVNGYKVEQGDIRAFEEAANKILSLPEKQYQEMRKNCRKTVEEKYSFDAVAEKYMNLYERIS